MISYRRKNKAINSIQQQRCFQDTSLGGDVKFDESGQIYTKYTEYSNSNKENFKFIATANIVSDKNFLT